VKVYLADYEIYHDVYGVLCESSYNGYVFINFDKAHEYVKGRIDDWLEATAPTDEQEKEGFLEDVYCDFTIYEKDTEEPAVDIEWGFYYDGRLWRRLYHHNGVWLEELPEDRQAGAGTRFAIGDYVVVKEDARERYTPEGQILLLVPGGQPGPRPEGFEKGDSFSCERRIIWENIYGLVSLENGYWGHYHIHENDLELYTGEIPVEMHGLRKIYMGEAQITVGRIMELFGDNFSEYDNDVVKRIIEEHNCTDDSIAPVGLVCYMLEAGHLILPGNLYTGSYLSF